MSPRFVPDGDQALSELREISGCPEGLVEIGRLIDEGAPLLRAYIDHPPTKGAGDIVARYEISERLLPVLAAVRARNRYVGEVECALNHESSPIHPEILEVAAEIAAESDVLGLERSTLERLVRAVILLDRSKRDTVPSAPHGTPA